MKARRSVRTYDGQPITKEQFATLEQAIAGTYSPFDGNVTIRLKEFPSVGTFKPNTYGYINGAVDFFLIGMTMDVESAMSTGFRFEQVVLKAWQMGLGTCWIAATFDGTVFGKDQQWPAGAELRIVSPVGVAVNQSAFEQEIRGKIAADHRKPFGELFFQDGFQESLPEESRFGQALAMMRLAPSSKNSQPWRALVKGDTVHFYFKYDSEASVLDCGIGLCHFVETEKYNGRSGNFFRAADAPVAPEELQYLISYKAQ